MKLMYQGPASLESTVRIKRRSWFKEICWDLVGVVITIGAFWIFTVLMFTE